ncbi:uncharacterized protein LOC110022630 [Phalaenopsis equestris]|uniref:uncharacterized protein LOC110022630 n=1 Tax=Phalaenopsis equestris TaxID=78828 RepID=UPI0009E3339A|nr:uncharacterized protein LOC110022630 [Phalaenopsis equestris]
MWSVSRDFLGCEEITPVLKGSCRIQGPVDDLDLMNLQGTDSEKFVSNCTNRKAVKSSALTCVIDVESSLIREPSVPSVSPNCNQGADFINIEGDNGEKETSASASILAIIDDVLRGNLLNANLIRCESMANEKRERSCSIERMS